jgi:hypothetical protein
VTLRARLFSREVVPFYLSLLALAVAALLADAALHLLNAVWVGRWLGIPGVLLILGSMGYSLRKRKPIQRGKPVTLLRLHEYMAWAGSLLVLVHAGIHFNAILPWLATVAMGVNVISGLVGKMLLSQSRQHVQGERERFQLRGLSKTEVDQAVFWDAVALGAMAQWRKVHIPIFIVFAVLALGHIISIFLFWGWV